MKKLLFSFIVMIMPLMASADAVEIDGIYYNLISKSRTAEVTENPNNYSGTLVIPSSVTYEGIQYSVTSIGEKVFSYCWGLTSVTIPSSMSAIGDYAFYNCSGLRSAIIPNTITSIGVHAFSFTNLASIDIPSSVTAIGSYAFSHCTGLTSVVIPNSVTSVGNNAFGNCTSLASVTISNNITVISYESFVGCTSLSTITIPGSVKTISSNAFSGCLGLTSVTIGSGVASIGSHAFEKCKNLLDVYSQAESVPSMEKNAFEDSYPECITLHVPAKSINAYKAKEPWSKFYEIVAIEGIIEPESPKCATPEIKFSNDTFIFSCATQGVEFVSVVTVSDAKKYYDAKIKLAQTYKISVYATKNGYERSDIATKEIVITNDDTGSAEVLVGDVDGNGVVNVADHVELSKIIMGQGQ